MLSRKAILRPIGSRHPNPKGQSWSYAWKKDSTVWGLVHKADWQQFSDGRTYRICRPPSVTIGVAVSTGCWAHRRGTLLVMPISPLKICLTPGARYEKDLTTPIKAEDLQDIRVGDVIY